jgi:hypothetical protein
MGWTKIASSRPTIKPKGVVYPRLPAYSEYSTALNPYTNLFSHHIQTMAQACPVLVFKDGYGADADGG